MSFAVRMHHGFVGGGYVAVRGAVELHARTGDDADARPGLGHRRAGLHRGGRIGGDYGGGKQEHARCVTLSVHNGKRRVRLCAIVERIAAPAGAIAHAKVLCYGPRLASAGASMPAIL